MLARSSRLRSGDEIRDVVKRGQRHSSTYFTLHFLPADQSRFAVITGRVVGGAVQRNKIKRRITAAIRSELSSLNRPIDAVFRMRATAIECDYVALVEAVKNAFSKVRP